MRHELAGDFGFYAYDSMLGKLSIRRETIEKRDVNAWTIVTQPSENSPSSGSVVDSQGTILYRNLPSGKMMKPIDGKDLRNLWRRKGLPLK